MGNKATQTIERKNVAVAQFKQLDDAEFGGFEGYASVFDVADDIGDIVQKGAYAETLPEFIKRGFIADSHDWRMPIGTIAEAREDDYGLFLRAEYHSTEPAQRARTVAIERQSRGKGVYLSIGYWPTSYEDIVEDEEYVGRRLNEIELFEVSQVTVPMLREAEVTEVKGASIPFAKHAEQARTSLQAFRERCKSLTNLRVQQGREPYSSANRELIEQVLEDADRFSRELRKSLDDTDPEKAQQEFLRLTREIRQIEMRHLGVAI